jgi:glycosyl transferase family 25
VPRQEAFRRLEQTFDRIFVVTLARATERQARVRARLEGLRYEFFQGFDRAALDVAQLARDGVYDPVRARRMDRRRRALGPGELGAALSHRKIYEEAIRNGWNRVLVFEDDVLPRDADLAALPAALAELPAAWDLVYLGWTNFETVTARDRAKQATYFLLSSLGLMRHWSPREILRFHPSPFSPHLQRAGLHHCLHAYAFTLEGARKLLAAQTPIAFSADQLVARLVLRGALTAFITAPKFFDQETGPGGPGSLIEADRRGQGSAVV